MTDVFFPLKFPNFQGPVGDPINHSTTHRAAGLWPSVEQGAGHPHHLRLHLAHPGEDVRVERVAPRKVPVNLGGWGWGGGARDTPFSAFRLWGANWPKNANLNPNPMQVEVVMMRMRRRMRMMHTLTKSLVSVSSPQ